MAKSKTYTIELNRLDEDETEVAVHYTARAGTEDYYDKTMGCWYPGDPPEIEIIKVTAAGVEIEPTDAERNAWTTWVFENHEEDEGPDPDDERDRRRDMQMCEGE